MSAYTTTLPLKQSNLRLDVTIDVDASTQIPLVPVTGDAGSKFLEQMVSLFLACSSGDRSSSVTITTNTVAATGTFTIAAGNLSANDTVTIGGVTFTAKSSGATGNQFNIGGDNTATAAACAAAVNASSNTAGMVSATSALGVVTFTASAAGQIGNGISLAKSATNGSVSGANLSGGTQTSIGTNKLGF